jgi:hypothetical protein
MAHHRGPKTITEDLIFHYDTGNVKSFAGEPTTNIFTSYGTSGAGATSDNGVNFDVNGTGTFIRLGYGQTFGGYTIQPNDVVYKYDLGSSGCHYHGNDVLIPSGVYVTFSFDYYISPNAGNYPDTNYLGNMETSTGANVAITSPNSLTGVWQTISVTAGPTTSEGNLRPLLYPGGCGGRLASSGYILYKNPQVELKNHKTPFTSGTRSNTQSLLDLSKRSVMTVANASFNTNAMLNFDGTNDYIQLTSFPQPTNFITCEAWINPQDLVTPGTIRGGVISSTNSMYLGIFDSYDGTTFGSHWAVQTSTGARPYNVNGSIPRNQWTHLVGTYNGSVSRAYINGVEVWNSPLTGTIPSSTYYIGTYGGTIVDDTHNFNGYIPVAKIYNRALTAEQVLQNYNASKRRFGL